MTSVTRLRGKVPMLDFPLVEDDDDEGDGGNKNFL